MKATLTMRMLKVSGHTHSRKKPPFGLEVLFHESENTHEYDMVSTEPLESIYFETIRPIPYFSYNI